MNRIDEIFKKRTEKVIPFFTAGYPSKESMVDMVLAAEEAGADMIELGMPFSDPLADGPIIQESSQIAIGNGVNIPWILASVELIRQNSQIPLVLMGYINPIIKYGIAKFFVECNKVGVDGLIIPDLPPEEAESFNKEASRFDISIIFLVAPNTSNKRIKKISNISGSLIYCVAVLGITGSDSANKKQLMDYLKRVESYSNCPFIVGFGIKNRNDIIEINKMAHGAVVGTAIIEKIQNSSDPVCVVREYIGSLTGRKK